MVAVVSEQKPMAVIIINSRCARVEMLKPPKSSIIGELADVASKLPESFSIKKSGPGRGGQKPGIIMGKGWYVFGWRV